MMFHHAQAAVMSGEYIAYRDNWNGNKLTDEVKVWISYSPGHPSLPAAQFWGNANKEHAKSQGGTAKVGQCFTLTGADGTVHMGWRPTNEDMFADNWKVRKINGEAEERPWFLEEGMTAVCSYNTLDGQFQIYLLKDGAVGLCKINHMDKPSYVFCPESLWEAMAAHDKKQAEE